MQRLWQDLRFAARRLMKQPDVCLDRCFDAGVEYGVHTDQDHNHSTGQSQRDAAPQCENGTGDLQRAKSVARD